MDPGCACSPFTLITIRPIDEHQRAGVVSHNGRLVALSNHKHAGGAGAVGLPGELHQPGGLLLGAAAAHAWG
jgi:hypothetical protein